MPGYLGALTVLLLLSMVLSRVLLLKRQGITAMKFGAIDKTDFLIPPFMLFYFYLLFAAAFGWPSVTHQRLFQSTPAAWAGVAACAVGFCCCCGASFLSERAFASASTPIVRTR